jgi:hypothetical protein
MNTFRYAGVAERNGEFKLKFANSMDRVNALAKFGAFRNIDVVEVRHPMTRLEAVEYLLSIDFDNGNKRVREALEAKLKRLAPKAKAVAPVAELETA